MKKPIKKIQKKEKVATRIATVTPPIQSVPILEIDAPLAVEAIKTPSIDIVMVRAQRKWIIGLVIFILFIAAVIGIGVGYKGAISTPITTQTVAPTVHVLPPSPTPVVIMRIAIWNGSGIVGLAGKVGDDLKIMGYDIMEVKNAPETQTGTTLFLAPSVKSKELELKSAISNSDIEVTKVEVLASGDYEVRIVLGR